MASITDKITDTRNAARPVTARVTVARVSAGTTLQCNSLTGWPTASKVHFVTYQIDTNNDPIAGTQLDCYGIVSGSDITSMVVVDGTDGGNSVGDVAEMLPTSAWGQDLSDALTAQHTRTGLHTAVTNTGGMTTDTLTVTSGTTLPAGDIVNADLASNSVSTAKIQDDAVTAAKLADAAVFPANLTTGLSGSSWAWQAWTPTLSGRFTDAQWTKDCKYIIIGKTVFFRIALTANNTTPMGGAGDPAFTLPVTAVSPPLANDLSYIGTANIGDAGTAQYVAGITQNSTTVGKLFYYDDAAAGVRSDLQITNTIPMTWTTSDTIYGQGFYEAA